MKVKLDHAKAYVHGVWQENSFFEREIFSSCGDTSDVLADDTDLLILPGFADVHVHFREPGFSYKETIYDGSRAAAHGGFSAVCTMPNLNPAPDTFEHLEKQLSIIRRDAAIRILPYGTITAGERGEWLSDMVSLAPYVVAFSDDGRGVQRDEVMEAAMMEAKRLGKVIVAHCEDNNLLCGGYIHDGVYCRERGHKGICSESEWRQVERDLSLVRKTDCAYHVCHVSTRESVELIRQAKKEGLNVTCETAPHYLLMDDSMLDEDGRFKMNPPLRSITDREALFDGIVDGTIDMLVTDHAPHAKEEKDRGLEKSLMGVVGLETSFPLMYTYFVKTGKITLEKLMELMHDAPCRRFGIPLRDETDFTVFRVGKTYTVDPKKFLSKGRSTPFEGWKVYGECCMTVSDGKLAYLCDDWKEKFHETRTV